MENPGRIAPLIGLIDDDAHSAYLFQREMRELLGTDVCSYGGDCEAVADLDLVLSDPRADWPDLLVVDLKAHSLATLEFVQRHACWLRQKGIPLIAMVPPVDPKACRIYHEAGAAAVFFRQPERDAYRRELEGIENFRARTQRLDAVGM